MWQDLRFGLRMLRKTPGFTAVAVLTLALGIGATTAVFSIFKAVVLRPLPFHEPDRLVMLWERGPKHGNERDAVNNQLYAVWKEQNQVFSDMTFIWNFSYMSWQFRLIDDGREQAIPGRYVPPSFFTTLGVDPVLGRTFTRDEDVRDPDPVVVISHTFWQQWFGGDPDVVGKAVMLDNFMLRRPYTVVGVMPRGFEFPAESQIWVIAGAFRAPPKPPLAGNEMKGKGHDLLVFARLQPGVSVEQARADLTAISTRITERFPKAWLGSHVDVVPMSDELTGDLKTALCILVGAVASVLLIACANTANLLLARAATREREIALRTALGASRGRVMRQLLIESLLLAMLSGSLGIGLAAWGVDALLAIVPAAGGDSHANVVQSNRVHDVPIDGSVLGVSVAVTLLTGVLFGLAPVLHASKPALAASLNESGRSVTRSRAGQRILHTLVSGQVAIALVLLIAAGLMIQSFARLLQVDPGFEPRQLLTGAIDFSPTSYKQTDARVELARRLVERLETIPGVESACGVHELPLDRPGRWTRIIARDGQQHDPPPIRGDMEPVTPNYFRTMQIPLLAGRVFDNSDARDDMPQIAIINRKLAEQLFPDVASAIGQTIAAGHAPDTYWRTYEVVGVVGDTRTLRLDQPAPGSVYVPFSQMWPGGTTVLNLIARTSVDPMTLADSMRHEVLNVTGTQPVAGVRTIEGVFATAVARPRFQMTLLSVFATVALILAAMGIYGVMSWWVTSRTREIGIRMALGARPADVMKQIALHGSTLSLAGIVIGLFGSWSLTRILQSQLYETPAMNPVLFLSIAGLLLVVALAACIQPARRAMKVDPMNAIRCE